MSRRSERPKAQAFIAAAGTFWKYLVHAFRNTFLSMCLRTHSFTPTSCWRSLLYIILLQHCNITYLLQGFMDSVRNGQRYKVLTLYSLQWSSMWCLNLLDLCQKPGSRHMPLDHFPLCKHGRANWRILAFASSPRQIKCCSHMRQPLLQTMMMDKTTAAWIQKALIHRTSIEHSFWMSANSCVFESCTTWKR